MAVEVVMPQMGLTMTHGTVVRWIKQEGEQVAKNEALVEILTDKASFEVEAPESGVLLKVLAAEQEAVPIATVIAYIGQPGEALGDIGQSADPGQYAVAAEKPPGETPALPVTGSAVDQTAANRDFDVLVIGGGPGGYVAAIRAAQLGARTAVVEKADLGGTCLNRGCIPTKSLLAAAERVDIIRGSEEFGLRVSGFKIDFGRMMNRKNAVVKHLRNGVSYLLQKNRVALYRGTAGFLDSHTIEVEGEEYTEKVSADKMIIATGSVPRKLNFPGDTGAIVYSDEMLNLKEVPENLVIIGGGVIGIEFATIFNNLGTRVTIVEIMDRILPQMDGEITGLLLQQLKKKGINILTGAKVEEIRQTHEWSSVIVLNSDGRRQEINADKVLAAPGRMPFTDGLNLEAAGVNYSRKGIAVSGDLTTNISHIYAIGDVCGGMQLAHMASAQGIYAAERALGKKSHVALQYVPACLYTHPEVASVGYTEEQLQEKRTAYKTAKFPLNASGKAMAAGGAEGLVKIIYAPAYGEVLGVHMLAPRATDIVAEAALAMRAELTVDEIATTIHAHPTIAEALMEAAHVAQGSPIHIA